MKTISPILFAIVSLLNFNHVAKAESLPPVGNNDERIAMQAAVTARNEFVQALIKRDYVDLARAGFDSAVRDLAAQLQTQGLPQEANDLMAQWGNDGGASQFEMAFAIGLDDLGDHAPLFPWLNDTINKLADKYGSLILNLPIVKDIQMLNFALPVVFTPASHKWQLANQDNRIEYRKHFIPFANLVTYYAALYGCNAVAAKSPYPQLKQLCKKAAAKLQFVMGRYIAPSISDFIYKTANKKRVTQPSFGRESLRYENGDDLSREIRQGLMLQ